MKTKYFLCFVDDNKSHWSEMVLSDIPKAKYRKVIKG